MYTHHTFLDELLILFSLNTHTHTMKFNYFSIHSFQGLTHECSVRAIIQKQINYIDYVITGVLKIFFADCAKYYV